LIPRGGGGRAFIGCGWLFGEGALNVPVFGDSEGDPEGSNPQDEQNLEVITVPQLPHSLPLVFREFDDC